MSLEVDEPFFLRIEKAVEDAESRTAAEIVVVLSPQSGSYRDVDHLFGIGTAVIALIAILYMPWEISHHAVTLDVVIAGLAGGFLCRRLPGLRRRLTSGDRRARQVDQAMKVAFMDEEVSCTRDRSGVLVFYSGLEQELRIVPDQGLLAHLPRARFNELVHAFRQRAADRPLADGLEEVLRRLGEMLGGPCPRRDDDRNELSNRPRMAACET